MEDNTPPFEGRLRWSLPALLAVAILLADLPFDVGPSLLHRGEAGAASSVVGPIYWATHIGYGALLGLLWVGADRLMRGKLRPLGWALATGLAALLFSPDGVMYFANAFAFGAELALDGLKALWPAAVGYALVGYGLAWVLPRSRRPFPTLGLAGLAAGALGWLLSVLVSRLAGQPGATLLAAGGRWCVEGALIGLAIGVVVPAPSGRTGRLP
jgi:hypothetical protein